MKRILFVSFILMLTASAFGQQRSAKDIEKMFKGTSDVEAIMNGASFQDGNVLKTIILSESAPGLNDIERKLMSNYSQVALMCNMKGKPFLCYFVKDKENKRGVVSLNGDIIVPPLSGSIFHIPIYNDFSTLLVGELSKSNYAQIVNDWASLNMSRENGMLGLFSAIVVDANSSKIRSLLPLDEYIFLSLGSRGNGKYDIFTLKAVGDDALWGIVDIKGKEILPNKYTGFSRKTHFLDTNNTGLWGKWVGTTEMDMAEALQYSKDLKADTRRRRMELAQTLNSIGDTMMEAAQTVEELQNSSSDESDDSFDNVDKSKGGKDSKSKNNMSEHQSYNTDKSTYQNYDSILAQVFAGNRSATVSEISNWQSKMKQLREKWEAKGKSFPHSANEGRK